VPRAAAVKHLLVAGDVAYKIAVSPSCRDTFNFDGVATFTSGESVFVLLPYSSSAP